MYVSVIMPTFNKRERLVLALTSLINQTCPRDRFEVVLVDDGSTDGAAAMVQSTQWPFSIRVLRQENRGRSAARNRGIDECSGDLLVFTDDDLLLSPEFIESHVRRHDHSCFLAVHGTIFTIAYLKFFKDPINGVLFSEFQPQNRKVEGLKRWCLSCDDVLNRFETIRKKNTKRTRFEQAVQTMLAFPEEQRVSPWIGFTGGNVSIQKRHLVDMGLFDEEIGRQWGGEDLELGFRLCQAGCAFEHEERACNFHLAHYRPGYMDIHRRTHNLFYEKHKQPEIALLWDFFEGTIGDMKEYAERVLALRHSVDA